MNLYLEKKNENYKNQILALKNCLNKLRNDSSLWKINSRGGADMYLGSPVGMRDIDEALRRVDQLEQEFREFRKNLLSE